MDISELGVPEQALEGVWIEYVNPATDEETSLRLLIASSRGEDYRRAVDEMVGRTAKKGMRAGRMDFIGDRKKNRAAEIKLMAQHVLLNFVGDVTFNGKPLDGSSFADRCILLGERQVREFVELQAADIAFDLADEEDQELGNSGHSPAGPSGKVAPDASE